MNGRLREIFTTFRAYPDGGHSLEWTIEKAFSRCTTAVNTYGGAHGSMITRYDPGWYTDNSEKNVKYALSWPQRDVVTGHCVCTVGSTIAEGIVPTKRSILPGDGAIALVICLNKFEHLLPSTITKFQFVSGRVNAPLYVKTFITREYWRITRNSVEEYTLDNN